ncbi:MAG: shikimate kinase [Elusimicrobiota bacterium]
MNIVLTGFMGTGKSYVGMLLAKKLGWQFYDTDAMIEKDVGYSINEIFAKKGEPYFRDVESKAVRLVAILDKVVIACGGGVVLRKENMQELGKNGVVVCLTATPEKIYERTKYDTTRPLLKTDDPVLKIRELLDFRKEYYGKCGLIVDTSDITPEQVTEKILAFPQINNSLK